jgi:soluble lytic murein transglycosylase-like protein
VSRKSKIVSISCALALGLGTTTAAAEAAAPQIELLNRPAHRFERSIEAHKVERHYESLGAKAAQLTEKAQRIARQPEFGLAAGVSQSTLDAIASCESGGDPAAVDSSGTYYGLYQFDLGTWASVGGKGSPAEASPEEQSYRASLLYSRAGSSPWPVCG